MFLCQHFPLKDLWEAHQISNEVLFLVKYVPNFECNLKVIGTMKNVSACCCEIYQQKKGLETIDLEFKEPERSFRRPSLQGSINDKTISWI